MKVKQSDSDNSNGGQTDAQDIDTHALESDYGQVLDREQELHIAEHVRPHWMQAGTITFITIRLADSLPREVLIRWDREKLEFMRRQHIDCDDWRDGVEQLSESDLIHFQKRFRRARELELDRCHGACHLADPAAAEIVSNSLLFFDNDRYLLGDFVVMPNHVHLLAAFPDAVSLKKQCYSWMKYSATQINRLKGRTGSLWQEEPFNYLVRSDRQLEYLRSYIRQNPSKAGLSQGTYWYRRSKRHF